MRTIKLSTGNWPLSCIFMEIGKGEYWGTGYKTLISKMHRA